MSLSKESRISTTAQMPGYMAIYQSQDIIKTKKDFHEALDRNGYFVVPYKSGGCTIDYLKKVREGLVWCPMYVDVKLRSCYHVPNKEVIFVQVNNEIKRLKLKPFGFSDSSKVPSNYLIICLSTLNEHHRFFEKSFYPNDLKANTRSRKRRDDNLIVQSTDSFFNDLRQSSSTNSKNTVQM